MTRDEIIEEISSLPGVGKSKAEKLYDAGFTSLDALREATSEDLQKVPGIGPKIADAILQGLEELETEEEEEQEIEVIEEAAPARIAPAREATKEEPEEEEETEAEYVVRAKPELTDELQRDLAVRRARKARQPAFKRQQLWQFKKLKDVWRAPKGLTSKQQDHRRYRPRTVKAGYGSPVAARGLHPSGFAEVLVHNPRDLEGVDPTTEAARIGGSVGARKRELIENRAEELGIRILNPTGGR